MPIDVLLADDHSIVRQGLKDLLIDSGFAVVAECADGHQALKRAEQLQPSVAVLDLSMPLLNGVNAAREIQQLSPRTKVVILTVHREDHYVLAALRAGIKGYVLKMEAGTALVEAIHEARRGNLYISPGACKALVAVCRAGANLPDDHLTPRESDMLRLIAGGSTTREIAQQLNLTVKTAEFYRTGLMEKLDIHETANLVRYAVRRRLIEA
jgi:DNA-binding NarL/FixJ family response regulator